MARNSNLRNIADSQSEGDQKKTLKETNAGLVSVSFDHVCLILCHFSGCMLHKNTLV
jgi:hypothetical protein